MNQKPIDQAVIEHLLTRPTIARLSGGRIGVRQEGGNAPPAVVVELYSLVPLMTHQGPCDLATFGYQIEVSGLLRSTAFELAREIQLELHGLTGVIAGLRIDNHEVEMTASNRPSKREGGELYDWQCLLDATGLCVVDVPNR